MHLRNVFLAIFALAMVAYCQSPAVLDGPFQVRYAANLQNTNGLDSFVDVTNDGSNGAPLLGPGLGNSAGIGNLCVNVYVVDPGEELLACCSCLITPDQTESWTVKGQLLSKTLTGEQPDSVTIKLIGSNPGTAATVGGTSCANSAATLGTTVTGTFTGVSTVATAIGGYVAFGTTIHAQGASFVTTETPFLPVTLSSAELISLTGRCATIIGNGTTFGQCPGCTASAQGGLKQ